ncbi:DUF2835 family protein [Alteromonas confluentis]|uniref:DUF2835 domain-containing protein n=1 Tax=Alteromonas confluentis TaxID=1656094 RepID=A0A1E7ZD37_9ALTE|nr:DUF2835 family protein [Alteromonas confluentis]OFC71428.1 hypothetical protein BFC18_08105 [Alteromonas confluentis]
MNKPDAFYFFTLSLSYTDCQALYQSAGQSAILLSESGIRVQVPVSRLRPFIDSRGLKGRFRLVVSGENKIKTFERLR